MKKLAAVIIVLLFTTFGWYRFSLLPVDSGSQERHNIKIPQGTSVKGVAQILKDKGVIKSPLSFELFIRFKRSADNVQAGTFIIRSSQSVSEIAEILRTGKAEEAIITIPEGYTVTQIDTLLSEKGFSEAGEISKCARTCDFSSFEFLPEVEGLAQRGGKLEGYLYPDTYYVAKEDFVAKFFLERMLTTFRKRVLMQYEEAIEKSDRTIHELVTMASLIEKETRSDAQRPVVSGILWKRYDDERGLGVDATVRYILNKPTDEITREDLNNGSMYNTRKFRGLPPGPISTISIESFKASIKPEQSPYWYYLHGTDGQIHYAESNEEHNINRYNYIK
ncbi:endolytic transglycosylase MltG [Candidatus Peregrinibacteria bacterium]|jgi:UPF0755 protein|nr:endolytic transglycosylase MltG [Candidatus Peregrinibacteria bacterium]MBT3598651.1 endolytic transglycosylase MltG [Candidatus Peregrinibacteria bacterium]MBT6730950.1 endolytic transglycosylase MltG [Candidatus Peregrinibacteria bacterium]MBT7009909.1 endolytic transglycosylase MltG [Candidatus Peregrinibacteria bacterium]MBT7344692.1 endolytic transglycosylase MltG [Candidatus Peregrinibacteria bacterium]